LAIASAQENQTIPDFFPQSPLALAEWCRLRPAGKLLCLLRVGISEAGKMMCSGAGWVFLCKAAVHERTPVGCSCSLCRLLKCWDLAPLFVNLLLAGWLALFYDTLLAFLEQSTALWRLQTTGQNTLADTTTSLRDASAGLEQDCVCWEQQEARVGSPGPLVWLSTPACLGRLQFWSHHCFAFSGVFAPWSKAQW